MSLISKYPHNTKQTTTKAGRSPINVPIMILFGFIYNPTMTATTMTAIPIMILSDSF